MERNLILNTNVLSRLNQLITAWFLKPRYRRRFSIPSNVDLSQTSFSFGQYKGRLINQIWQLDKGYIKKLARQEWLVDYPLDHCAIHTLLENQRLFR